MSQGGWWFGLGPSTLRSFCEVNFNVDFPMASKVHVKGDAAHPFYRWAADELGFSAKPRWNFHKYLLSRRGELVGSYESRVRPDDPQLIRAIERQLAN